MLTSTRGQRNSFGEIVPNRGPSRLGFSLLGLARLFGKHLRPNAQHRALDLGSADAGHHTGLDRCPAVGEEVAEPTALLLAVNRLSNPLRIELILPQPTVRFLGQAKK